MYNECYIITVNVKYRVRQIYGNEHFDLVLE